MCGEAHRVQPAEGHGRPCGGASSVVEQTEVLDARLDHFRPRQDRALGLEITEDRA